MVIKTAIKEDVIMTVKTAEQISDQIVAAFPKEVKDYYFMREGSKAPKGKLYAKYHNVVRNLKNGGLIESTKRPKPSNVEMSNVRHMINFDSETDIDQYLNSLNHDNCTFNEIEVIWKATVKYRLNYIKNSQSTTETLKHWSSYKLPAGYKLIDIDFNMLYPSASNLLTIYPDVSSKLMELLKLKIKDSQSLKLLDEILEKNLLENGRDACIFHLLHAVFIPTAKKSTRNEKGQKSMIKFSIRDSQQSFMINVDTVLQFEDIIARKKGLGIPIQPFIVIIGQLHEPKDIIVYFDDIKYKVLTIQRAVDVVFKLFHTFNLLYPDESYILWLFIQKFFYNIHIKSDQSHPIISLIISELNK
ncbi:unnamed protein product [Macrosiphum euphorbiae]|uniref:DNA-directed DNA polymerase n=1 Tax=Macrosiphum euphorbiae TaxID=13131 RepID=A0AAV0Y0P7_9HEMI|nr:unnamed protein product [Macrosiphum euphorbiae]